MSEAKALYNSPSNRGSAFIFNQDIVNTPISLLQKQQAQHKKDAELEAKAQAQRAKDGIERMSKLLPTPGKYMPADEEKIRNNYLGIRDFVAEGSMAGKDYTNPWQSPMENSKLLGMVQDLQMLYQQSGQDLEKYNNYIKPFGEDKDGLLDATTGYELGSKFYNSPYEERRGMELTPKRVYNIANIAKSLFTGYEPEEDGTYNKDGKGSIIHRKVKTYSANQLENMTKLLLEDPRFREVRTYKYNSMSEEEKNDVGGLYGYLESEARGVVDNFQRENVDVKYGTDAAFWQNRSFGERQRQFNANYNKADDKARENAERRADYLQAMANGDWDKLEALANTKAGGGNVLKVEPIMEDDPKFRSGKVSGVPDLYGSDKYASPMIRLTVRVGDVTVGEGDEKSKKVQTKTVDIDTSKPGWEKKVSALMNVEKGDEVAPELLDEVSKAKGYTYSAKAREEKKTSKKESSNPYGISIEDEASIPNPYGIDIN